MDSTVSYCAAAVVAALLVHPATAAAEENVCPRPGPSADVLPPPDLYSSGGVLKVDLEYRTTVDLGGRTLFCYQTSDGLESPTLHVNPGDTISIHLTNKLPPVATGPGEIVANKQRQCGDNRMNLASVNMRFHG